MTTTVHGHAAPPVDAPADELCRILDDQRADYLRQGPPSSQVRLDRIDRFLAAVLENADELAAAISADFGNRHRLVSFMADMAGVLPELALIRENLDDWMADQPVPGSAEAGVPTYVQTRPKGVVGVIGPWNFPLLLVIHPAMEALAAGNRIMIKVSELAPRTADVFAEAVAARMSPEEAVVIRGGVGTAAEFSDLPFDHLIFTGSPVVGAAVAQAAGKNLVPVTLELGGKNPVVVGSDADLDTAAARVAGVRMLNGGQICLCPDYVFVPRTKLDEFTTAYANAISHHYPAYRNNPGVVSIINERNFDRVNGLVSDARAKGATVLTLVPDDEKSALPDRDNRLIAPTVLLGVTPEMRIASEEVFGPVLAVYPYDDLDDVIDYVNAAPSPLAAYFFGSDGEEFQRFSHRTTSGALARNDLAMHWHVEGAPSGGVGRSGMGAYSGKIGFDTFSHHRTVAASATDAGFATQLIPPAGDAEADAVLEAINGVLAEINGRIDESEQH